MVREFLDASGLAYSSWDVANAPEARRRLAELGGASVPAIQVSGAAPMVVLHPLQVASAVGLEVPIGLEPSRHVWDLAAILDAWVGTLWDLDGDLVTRPTPSRGRTVRDLVVNVGRPLELVIQAWDSGEFDWAGAVATPLRPPLGDHPSVVRYAVGVRDAWRGFALEHFGGDAPAQRVVHQPGGETLSFSTLVANQRFHAAFHLRQVHVFLARLGCSQPGAAALAGIADLVLPDDVFG